MVNIRLTIEYDGANYNGWQKQSIVISPHSSVISAHFKSIKTIQSEVEKAIKKITGNASKLYASGRTDSGVHAKAQIANFHTKSDFSLNKLLLGLNAVLPNDIAITKVEKKDSDFHSRFSAKSKIYRYTILNRKSRSPILSKYTLHIPYKLDLAIMKKEAKVLLGKHNFRSFEGANRKAKSAIRTIKKITIKKNKESVIIIEIEANGFLYNMVRNIVGTLIDVGRGKIAKGGVRKILRAKNRSKAGPTAKAHGLCLMKVKY